MCWIPDNTKTILLISIFLFHSLTHSLYGICRLLATVWHCTQQPDLNSCSLYGQHLNPRLWSAGKTARSRGGGVAIRGALEVNVKSFRAPTDDWRQAAHWGHNCHEIERDCPRLLIIRLFSLIQIFFSCTIHTKDPDNCRNIINVIISNITQTWLDALFM